MKSRPFTILEIVIVLMLIGVTAVFGIGSLKSLLEKHQYQAEIDQFKSLLQELQVEALALRSDMEIQLTKSDKGWTAKSKTAETILRSETIPLKHVKEIFLNLKPAKNIQLNIFSTGRIEPAALIELKGEKESLWVDLREPIQIKFSSTHPKQLAQKTIPKKPKEKYGPEELRV